MAQTKLLLAGENKHPLHVYSTKKLIWHALLKELDTSEDKANSIYILYGLVSRNKTPLTYSALCKLFRGEDRLKVLEADTECVVARMWELPYNPVDVEAVKEKPPAKAKEATPEEEPVMPRMRRRRRLA